MTPENADDIELRGIAMGAVHEHEVSVTAAETDSALASVRARIASGDGGATAVITGPSRRRSSWLMFGAAAAVVAMVTVGLVAALGGGSDGSDVIVPATDPPVAVTVPGTTVVPDTTMTPQTSTTVTADGSEPAGALAVERNCVSDFDCTQLANTEDGRMVAYDPVDRMVRVYDATGSDLLDEVTIDADVAPLDRAQFVAVGPDDVAYLRPTTPGATDPSNDLLAIPLAGDDAGEVVMGWTGLDGSGDSTLIPRTAGLTVVNCCGPGGTRPEPDATIYRWVDRSGDVIESDAPSFDLNLGDAGNSLTRIDGGASYTRFPLPTVFQYPRDFPTTVATTDGGALSSDVVQTASGGVNVVVRFGPDWPDNGDVYFQSVDDTTSIALLEPTGTVVIADGDSFVRRELDEIATSGWPGRIDTDRDGAIRAPGLNDHIEENQPFWADDPELFALQLASRVGPNESVLIEFDESDAPAISITTDGFLDDSVAASQRVITTERADDGLLRFVSASDAFRCQPGRGHQDFSTELCT